MTAILLIGFSWIVFVCGIYIGILATSDIKVEKYDDKPLINSFDRLV